MKTKAFFLCGMLLLGASDTSFAGSVSSATITRLAIYQQIGSFLFISVDQPVNAKPACSTNTGFQFAIPLSTEIGRQTMALLLSARAAQISVDLAGSGSCDLYSNVETLVNVIL
jgi:hypothetical protein